MQSWLASFSILLSTACLSSATPWPLLLFTCPRRRRHISPTLRWCCVVLLASRKDSWCGVANEYALFRNSFRTHSSTLNNAPPQSRLQTLEQRHCLAYYLKTLQINFSATSTLATNDSSFGPSYATCVCFEVWFGLLGYKAFYFPVLVLLCVCMVAHCRPFGFWARGGMRIALATSIMCYFWVYFLHMLFAHTSHMLDYDDEVSEGGCQSQAVTLACVTALASRASFRR